MGWGGMMGGWEKGGEGEEGDIEEDVDLEAVRGWSGGDGRSGEFGEKKISLLSVRVYQG